jgi:hypothetical protein
MRKCRVCGTKYLLIDGVWKRQQQGDREHACWGDTISTDKCDALVNKYGEMEELTAMLTQSRVEELLDYATVYGDWDETTPNGETHNLSGEPMNDCRRTAIICYKKVLGLLPDDYSFPAPKDIAA